MLLSKDRNHQRKAGDTRLAAIRVRNIDDSLEVWNKTILNCICIVVRQLYPIWRDTHYSNAWKIFMLSLYLCVIFITPISYRPEGTYAVITKHGEFLEIKKSGGIYFCMPYVHFKSFSLLSLLDMHPIFGNTAKYCLRFEGVGLPYLRQYLHPYWCSCSF